MALLSVYFALCTLAGVFLAEATLHPIRRPLVAHEERHFEEIARSYDAMLLPVSLQAADGSELRGWNLRPRKPNGAAVILLHGLSDNRMGMIGYAEMLINRGFKVLMPDARAHGISGGAIATYGLLEADDIHRWYSWLEEQERPSCIFGFGESMGAAQLLQGLEKEPNFCAVSVESSFSNFREIAYDRVGQFFHTGPWLGRYACRPIVETAFLYARWRYHLAFDQISPERNVSATKVPILLIHGQQDSNISIRHAHMIAVSNPHVELWVVPGADHCGAATVAHDEFERRLLTWFLSHSGA